MHAPSGCSVEHMHLAPSVLIPQCIATEAFTNATAAVARLEEIYERNTAFLRDCFRAFANGESTIMRVRATYPFVRITTATYARLDSRLSYGFVAGPGVHETTVNAARPFSRLFHRANRALDREPWGPGRDRRIGRADPSTFCISPRHQYRSTAHSSEKSRVGRPLRDLFDTPDLAAMDDAIVNGALNLHPGTPEPLALFRAARVDYSLHRLFHYTGTDPEHFQNFVIFTNYQFYVDAFGRLCHEHMASGRSGYRSLCRACNVITRNGRLGGGMSAVVPERMPQMPAFHLVEPGY